MKDTDELILLDMCHCTQKKKKEIAVKPPSFFPFLVSYPYKVTHWLMKKKKRKRERKHIGRQAYKYINIRKH